MLDAGALARLAQEWVRLDRVTAAPGLMAHIAIGKYVDHLPLYRQEPSSNSALASRSLATPWLAGWTSSLTRSRWFISPWPRLRTL